MSESLHEGEDCWVIEVTAFAGAGVVSAVAVGTVVVEAQRFDLE